ncbi:MAG: MarR family transcriptional regulator [Bacteroidetes bacterium]|nr:MAG: MarR family transcriptional regulator [Bacteroidota bacterium]
MEDDFIKTLDYAGFTARIKRLSDGLIYDARKLYEYLDIGIEPNWHLIFLLLKKEKQLTVTEIAQQLGFTHPAIIKIIRKMKELGYAQSHVDPEDSRKQLIQLTQKGLDELPDFEEKWKKISLAVQEMVDPGLMQKLNELEQMLSEQSLYERCLTKIEGNECN